jgi:hypothetical protein
MWDNLNFIFTTTCNMSRDSLVRLVTKLNAGRPKNRGLILGRDKKFFFSLTRPGRHRGLPSLQVDVKNGCFPGSKARGEWILSITIIRM